MTCPGPVLTGSAQPWYIIRWIGGICSVFRPCTNTVCPEPVKTGIGGVWIGDPSCWCHDHRKNTNLRVKWGYVFFDSHFSWIVNFKNHFFQNGVKTEPLFSCLANLRPICYFLMLIEITVFGELAGPSKTGFANPKTGSLFLALEMKLNE